MKGDTDINYWQITPNVGVGEFHMSDGWNVVEKYMKSHGIRYVVEKNRTYYSMKTDNIIIAFDKNKRIFAISVFNDFKGKISNSIGLGSTLHDVKRYLGEYIDGFNDYYPTYELTNIKGIEFKLSDDDKYDCIMDVSEWDETIVPIVEITVWNYDTWEKQVEYKKWFLN